MSTTTWVATEDAREEKGPRIFHDEILLDNRIASTEDDDAEDAATTTTVADSNTTAIEDRATVAQKWAHTENTPAAENTVGPEDPSVNGNHGGIANEVKSDSTAIAEKTVLSESSVTAESVVDSSDGIQHSVVPENAVNGETEPVAVNSNGEQPSRESPEPAGNPDAPAESVQHSSSAEIKVNGDVTQELVTTTQNALLLHAVKEKYSLVTDHAVPSIIHDGEILVRVIAIGLNPIDWKAPAFNFGIPSLPWIFGRDLAGIVIQTPSESSSSRVKVGDTVLVPSTDYRDIRKAAFQEYAVATHYNAARIPPTTSIHGGASLGVAFVAAALALGISFGLDFSKATTVPGPSLTKVLRDVDSAEIPEDVRDECFSCVSDAERIQRGDWVAIWGASTTTGYIALQLAKLCGLKVICVADIARHGARLSSAGADLLVDRLDTNRAIEIIRGVTGGRLRFGLDIVGRETATILQKALFTSEDDGPQAHLLGLTGVPKETDARIRYHSVPIKIFHSSPAVGESLMTWLEGLLESKALTPPEVVVRQEGGLADINDALEVLKQGSVSGKRIVVDLGSGR